jgi:hypothetical protein
MFETSSANLIGDFVFGPDWFCPLHLRQAHEFLEDHALRPCLMIFPYFIADTVILYAIGAFGTAAPLLLRQ